MAKGFKSSRPGGMSGMGGVNPNMIKQAQKMQQDMLKMQEELKMRSYEASVGGGVVKAIYNGNNMLDSITIDPEAVDPDDVEMLQDMIVSAVNEAARLASVDAESSMGKITGGLNLGGLGF